MPLNHNLETLARGGVVVNIGQLQPETERALNKLVKQGRAAKWRGKWYPTAGAAWGMGPDKTCWALRETAEQMEWCNPDITAALAKSQPIIRPLRETQVSMAV